MKNSFNLCAASILLCFSLLSPAMAGDYSPNWCKSPKLSTTEKMICDDRTLRSADLLMSNVYADIMKLKGKPGHEGMWHREVYSDQIDWLKKRNQADSQQSLLDLYLTRTQALANLIKNRTR